MSTKERLDVLLTDRGFYPSREKAKAAIMAGLVFVDGERVDKAGTKVKIDSRIEVAGNLHPYVSRGGLKLEKALRTFGVSMEGRVVIDIGASTGGFTDCALQHGARLVYAVDVGYGQLAWQLRQDPRVIVMERTNFRHLKPADLPADRPDIAVMDVSFISVRLLFPVIKSVLVPGGTLLSLIKPQFEAGREKVGKNGIVRDPETHREVLVQTLRAAAAEGFAIRGLTFSPITGGDGNIEFLAHLVLSDRPVFNETAAELVAETVRTAHETLRKDPLPGN
ncbi:TlyA family RNA methyltransferase [Effusibacillus pohliae]|uniref:TlyA family RNA methyltransferase n=1 Tax=Effusibacillus pohliae TaxID=232270 RepID=UPI0003678310|nr:TlyA family RNA methyltransferase [Effusibacillus pohliae]